MRLGNTIGDRINQFDELDVQNVESFNSLFIECPIRNKCPALQVSIGGPAANNTRLLAVGEETFLHKMYSDILYTLDRDEYHVDEREIELTEMNGVLI